MRKTRKAGLTIIELISALVLLVMIFALLMTIFRIATHLWVPDQAAKQLQTRGDTVTDILASDFYQAIADRGVITGGATNDLPCFVLDCNTNTLANTTATPQIVLYFVRHASPRTPAEDPALRNALDAVFYVCYSNCLSRHIFPLERDTWADNTQTLGYLLEKEYHALRGEILSIYNWFRNPMASLPARGLHSLLADRCEFAAIAILPPETLKNAVATSDPFVTLDQCEAYVVPDFLDIALLLYDEAEWNVLIALSNDTSQEANMKRAFLGKQFSKRMAYPAKGGARL